MQSAVRGRCCEVKRVKIPRRLNEGDEGVVVVSWWEAPLWDVIPIAWIMFHQDGRVLVLSRAATGLTVPQAGRTSQARDGVLRLCGYLD